MKNTSKVSLLSLVLMANFAFAGRPTPKSESLSEIAAVLAQARLVDFVRKVEAIEEKHYLLTTQSLGETFCRTRGYTLTLVSRHPLTAQPTFEVNDDGIKRDCTQ